MEEILVNAAAMARMADDVNSNGDHLKTNEMGSCAAGGSQAVSTALEMFSTSYVTAAKEIRSRLNSMAEEIIASRDEFLGVEQDYAAAFRSLDVRRD